MKASITQGDHPNIFQVESYRAISYCTLIKNEHNHKEKDMLKDKCSELITGSATVVPHSCVMFV